MPEPLKKPKPRRTLKQLELRSDRAFRAYAKAADEYQNELRRRKRKQCLS